MTAACPYADWMPGSVAFCEERLCAWIVEPSNTFSSLAYLIVAAWMWRELERPRDARLVCIVVAQLVIGLGSLLFHGTGTLAGELVDQAGMFLLSCLILTLAAATTWGWSARTGAWSYAGAVGASAGLNAWMPRIGIPLFAAQLLAGIVWELRLHRRALDRGPYRYLFRSLAIFAVSFVFWALDISRVLCRPDNHLVTGHAVWHVLNAFSIYELYRFQRARLAAWAGPGGGSGGTARQSGPGSDVGEARASATMRAAGA